MYTFRCIQCKRGPNGVIMAINPGCPQKRDCIDPDMYSYLALYVQESIVFPKVCTDISIRAICSEVMLPWPYEVVINSIEPEHLLMPWLHVSPCPYFICSSYKFQLHLYDVYMGFTISTASDHGFTESLTIS